MDSLHKGILVTAFVALIVTAYFAVSFTLPIFVKRPSLRVGTNTPFPPFEMRDGSDITGFDIELSRLIAKSLGMELVVVDIRDFYALLPALKAGDIDMVASAVTITQKRSEVFSFSRSYYNASQAILVLSGSTVSDFNSVTVAYQAQTTSEDWVKNNLKGKTIVVGDLSEAFLLLKSKRVQAIVLDEPVAREYAKEDKALSVAKVIPTGEQYGFVVQKNDPQKLLSKINQTIENLIKSGEYSKLISRWFK